MTDGMAGGVVLRTRWRGEFGRQSALVSVVAGQLLCIGGLAGNASSIVAAVCVAPNPPACSRLNATGSTATIVIAPAILQAPSGASLGERRHRQRTRNEQCLSPRHWQESSSAVELSPPAMRAPLALAEEGARQAPPAPGADVPVTLPGIAQSTLPTGLQVVSAKTGNVPLATMTLAIRIRQNIIFYSFTFKIVHHFIKVFFLVSLIYCYTIKIKIIFFLFF